MKCNHFEKEYDKDSTLEWIENGMMDHIGKEYEELFDKLEQVTTMRFCPGCGKYVLKKLFPYNKHEIPCTMYKHLNRNDIIMILKRNVSKTELNKVLKFYGHKRIR